jgi:prophage regulatory protein
LDDITKQTDAPRLLSRSEVLARIPVTYPTLWAWMKAGTFPRGRKIGGSRVAWLESDITDWIAGRPKQTLKGD